MSQVPVMKYSKQALLAQLDEDFDRFTEGEPQEQPPAATIFAAPTPRATVQALPRQVQTDIDALLVGRLSTQIERLVWLNEGPDAYDTIDDTNIGTVTESRYPFDPYVIWAITLTNNGPSGNLFVRFTQGHGRIKQYKVPVNRSTSINDIKGGFGGEFRIIADTPNIEFIAYVSLKNPIIAF